MRVQQAVKLFDAQTTTSKSAVLTNTESDTLTIQVITSGSGTFTLAAQGNCTGNTDSSSADFVDLFAMAIGGTSSMATTTSIAADGIYTMDISGLSDICLNLSAVSSKTVNVYARMTSKV